MIDPTTQQSAAYSKLIEAPGVTQDEIDYKALQILRGLSTLDISEVAMDVAEQIKAAMIANSDKQVVGEIVDNAIWSYCQSIAKRELEA